MSLQAIQNEIDSRKQRHIEELVEFLCLPSISTYSQNAGDIRKAAEWVFGRLERLGFQTQIHETARHPVVFAQRPQLPDRPTLLIYGHYDVQPPEPLAEWVTPPFSPTIRDGFIYARGATDDKGQFLTYLRAMEAILDVSGEIPVNVKVLVEGEEEIGSPSLEAFLRQHAELLKANAVTISDGSKSPLGTPVITLSLRGLCTFQLDIRGPRFDLHSGIFGGIVTNPVQALAEILARLKTSDGRVAIPGFYDDVLPMEQWERDELAALSPTEEEVKTYLGVSDFSGERGYTLAERQTARPTLDANGIWGGFAGEGAKTVIPARAGAKVSLRLVPRQRYAAIARLFTEFVRSITPVGVTIEITDLHGAHGADPVLIPRDSASVRAAARAIEKGFGQKPGFFREGGSIPIVNLFREVLQIEDILLLPWGRPDDGAHSPNERFSLDDYHHGIRSAAALLMEFA